MMGHMLFTPATTIQFWSRPSSSVEKYVLHQWLMYAKTTVMMMASIDLLWQILYRFINPTGSEL